jgi:hypothetical protein
VGVIGGDANARIIGVLSKEKEPPSGHENGMAMNGHDEES